MSRYIKSMNEAMHEVDATATHMNEVSPPGWEGTVKAMKKHSEIDNPWALAWHMKKKGYKSHKKEEVSKESKHYGPDSHLGEPSPEDKFDYKPKKGEVVAPGSGSIAKAKKAKASDVNKSIEQQMADARKENIEFDKEKFIEAEGKLPPHLAKFFDKKGNPNKEAQARMDAGKKKREVAAKVKDVTPKGYGPSEEVEIDELTTDQKKKREASRERTHSGHKSYRQAHDADRGQKKPDRNVRKYWEKPSSMRAGPKGKLPEDVEKESVDTWHPDPEKDRKTTSMKHTAKSVAHQAAQKKKPATFAKIDTRAAAKKVQDILNRQRERKAAASSSTRPVNAEFEVEGIEKKTVIRKGKKVTIAQSTKAGHKIVNTGGTPKEVKQSSTEKLGRIKSQKAGAKKRRTTQAISQAGRATSMTKAAKLGLHKESLEFEVKITGIPKFYVPAKTAAQVKLALRKQLKHPEDIESITRVTKARQKIDFRLRAQGKGPKSEPLGSKRFRKNDVE